MPENKDKLKDDKPSCLEKMALEDIRPAKLHDITNEELTSIWHRLSQWYANDKKYKRSTENVVNAALWVFEESRKRNLNFDEKSELASDAMELKRVGKSYGLGRFFHTLPKEIPIVTDFVQVVGSEAEHMKESHDMDVVVRADICSDSNNHLRLQWDACWVALRRHLDKYKSGDVHYIPSPQGSFTDNISLYDLVLRRKPDFNVNVVTQKEGNTFEPFTKFNPQKPTIPLFTELYDPSELWTTWGENHKPFFVEPKYNGFRTIIEKKGDQLKMWFEGNHDLNQFDKKIFGAIKEAIGKVKDDFTIDGDIGILENGKRLPRNDLVILNGKEPELKNDQKIIFTAYDILYNNNNNLADRGESERRESLENFFKENLNHESFDLSPQKKVATLSELRAVTKWAFDFDRSEGLMAKCPLGKYSLDGTSDDICKLKKAIELKVIVLGKTETKSGDFTYLGGVLPSKGLSFINTANLNDKQYINLGNSFSTSINAKIGDILTVEIEEIIPIESEKGNSLSWYSPRVIDIDETRKDPYFVSQVIDIAERRQLFQSKEKNITKSSTEFNILSAIFGVEKQELSEGGTREGIASSNWENNWIEMLPEKTTEGDFVYQHHWQGLDENQTELSNEDLLKTDHSLHGDLRLEADESLFGFTVFLGKASDQGTKGDKFFSLPAKQENLQIQPKLPQPKEWLKVGTEKPLLVEPGSINLGGTKQKWSKFFAMDKGKYKIGYAKQHFVELFLDGKNLNGRYIFQFAPVGEKRIWLVDKPENQTPTIDTIDIKKEIADQKAKNRKWIYLSRPGWQKPIIVDLSKANADEIALLLESKIKKDNNISKQSKTYDYAAKQKINKDDTIKVEIKKADKAKRIVYGVVLRPNMFDSQGDIMTPEDVEKAAHLYMERARKLGQRHKKEILGVVLESYIAPVSFELGSGKVEKDDWVLVTRVDDDDVWSKVESGEYDSYSVGGLGIRQSIA